MIFDMLFGGVIYVLAAVGAASIIAVLTLWIWSWWSTEYIREIECDRWLKNSIKRLIGKHR